MAEVPAATFQEADDAKKKVVLEEKSKEDLVKIVKKQLILLKKAKDKTDDLNKRCSSLEEEKKHAVDKQSTTLIQLQQQVEKMEIDVLNLSQEKADARRAKEDEIKKLEDNLKAIESEKNAYFASLNEREERMQCTLMQLNTMKETCHCFQEELGKLQKANQDMRNEINILTEARDAALEALKSQNSSQDSRRKEHDDVVDEMKVLTNKYYICVEENCTLTSKIENLEIEMKSIQLENAELLAKLEDAEPSVDNDIVFLMTDNQKLQSELNGLKSENYELKEKVSSFEKQTQMDSLNEKPNAKTNQQSGFLEELQQALCDTENKNSILTTVTKDLETKNSSITEKLEEAEAEIKTQSIQLESSEEEILKLKKEIEKLTTLHELSDFGGAYEHALLAGAPTASVVSTFELHEKESDKSELSPSTDDQFNTPSNKTNLPADLCYAFDIENTGAMSGVEFALLGGGDVSEMFTDGKVMVQDGSFQPEASGFIRGEVMDESNFELPAVDKAVELMVKYKEIEMEKESLSVEINTMRTRFDEYSSLLQETIAENESLKLKLEDYENEKQESISALISIGTNTDTKVTGEITNDEGTTEIQTEKEALEKQNFELSEKLNSKCSELEELNFQLELIIISIKQGVRQKTSATANKPDKELRENISALKTLVDDLIIRCNTSAIKIKAIETDLEDLHCKKQALDEELFQVKELNQFLEYEVEQLKTQNTTESYYIKSPELYSIEEIDEKAIPSDPAQESLSGEIPAVDETKPGFGFEETDSKPVLNLCESDMETGQSKTDASVQACTLPEEISSCDGDLVPDKRYQEEVNDYQAVIEKLNMENSDLKSALNDKSVLVERIHCEMDSLLEKIESANYELQVKDDDLKNAQCKVADLQNRIKELESERSSKTTALKCIEDNLAKLRSEKEDLKTSVLSLSEFSSKVLLDASKSVTDQFRCLANRTNDENSHLKKISIHMTVQCEAIIFNLKLWQSTVEKILNLENNAENLSTVNDEVNSLKKTILDLSESSMLDDKCDKECCATVSALDQLHVAAQQFLLVICNYLSNDSYHSTRRELDNYRTSIVPNLETTIMSLENKLHENVAEKEKKELTSSFSEQQLEKGSEESGTDIKSQLADTEVKMNKFKQIAMKLKKELVETKKQNKEIISERDKCVSQLSEIKKEFEKVSTDQFKSVQNYQSLQTEYDKLQDEIEIFKENKAKLETDFSTTLLDLNSYREKLLTSENDLNKANHVLDATVLAKQETEKMNIDLESKIIVLNSKSKDKEQKILELETSISQKFDNIKSLTEENAKLKGQLDSSLKDEKKNNLLDLEMADYERSINELNTIVSDKEEEIDELKLKLDLEVKKTESLLQEISYTETLKETEEKRAQSLKEILEKTKFELSSIKENEAEMRNKVFNLQTQLELANQQEETHKLQLVEMSSEMQHLKDVLKTSSENSQRLVHSLESKISMQKEEIAFGNKEVEGIRNEFENYKVRVHSVLKQQKSSVPTVLSIDDDVKEKLESMIDKFKVQVKDLSKKLKVVTIEYETLQEEYDALLERQQKTIENREKKDSEWHLKVEQLNTENNRLRATQEELSSQHLLQNEMLVSTYKKQIKIMNEEHKRTICELQKQLEAAEAHLQRDQQKTHGLPTTVQTQDNIMSTFDIFTQERQEGEGSESIDLLDASLQPLPFSTVPTTEFQSFEKLLQTPMDSGTSASFVNYQDCEKLLTDLNAANKMIEHLNDVLNDSESTDLRLSEQVRVLKEEVRRLERNKEREQHAENLEYLKNVFIKFATLSACSEKAMLIPVLTTMLKLSPTEQQQLKSVAGDVDPDDTSSSGWGSYLHRWSGLA